MIYVLYFSLLLVSSFGQEINHCRKSSGDSERRCESGQSEHHALAGKPQPSSRWIMTASIPTGKLSEPVCLVQDELTTTKRSYEDQLSMMSDHLCSMNETLSKQREEIDTLKLGGKVRRRGGGASARPGKVPNSVLFSRFELAWSKKKQMFVSRFFLQLFNTANIFPHASFSHLNHSVAKPLQEEGISKSRNSLCRWRGDPTRSSVFYVKSTCWSRSEKVFKERPAPRGCVFLPARWASGSHGPEHVCLPPVAIPFLPKKKSHRPASARFLEFERKTANVDRLDQQHRNAHPSFFFFSFREITKRTRAARAVVRTPFGSNTLPSELHRTAPRASDSPTVRQWQNKPTL